MQTFNSVTYIYFFAFYDTHKAFISMLVIIVFSTGSFQTNYESSSLPAHSFVCTQVQYIFIHQCLLQWLSGGTGGTSASSQ